MCGEECASEERQGAEWEGVAVVKALSFEDKRLADKFLLLTGGSGLIDGFTEWSKHDMILKKLNADGTMEELW